MPTSTGALMASPKPGRLSFKSGVGFEKYGFPGQDARGIWTAPSVDNATGGAKVAWFKDPDGNVLSITQFANI